MEGFSNFIYEELFMLKEEYSATLPTSPSASNVHKLAVITGGISEEEKALLEDILSALNLDKEDIFNADEVMVEKSDKWLIFGESFELKSVHLEFYHPTKIDNSTFVLAHPLSVLRESQNEKKNLWNSLKKLFGI